MQNSHLAVVYSKMNNSIKFNLKERISEVNLGVMWIIMRAIVCNLCIYAMWLDWPQMILQVHVWLYECLTCFMFLPAGNPRTCEGVQYHSSLCYFVYLVLTKRRFLSVLITNRFSLSPFCKLQLYVTSSSFKIFNLYMTTYNIFFKNHKMYSWLRSCWDSYTATCNPLCCLPQMLKI